ncbi:MAG: LysR family transcriptional regulator [Nitrospirae bacterium]|nr:LysR family transcriptional regulator [Nitrospirota bacterium]
MDDYRLKVFCTVAEVKSFSKASEIIHLTQPAVTAQIHVLEELYGMKLFDRTTSSVSLTTSGEILYKYAKDILSLYADVEKNLCRLSGIVRGSIRIGSTSTISNYFLPKILGDFIRGNGKIKFDLRIGNTRKVLDLVASSNVDIAFLGTEVKGQKFVVKKIYEDELCVIVPASFPMAEYGEIDIDDLLRESFLLREDGSGTRQAIEKFLNKRGIGIQNMKVAIVLESQESVIAAVGNGMGVSIVSRLAADKDVKLGLIKTLRIKGTRLVHDFSIVHMKKRISSHVIEEFLAFVAGYVYSNALGKWNRAGTA